METNNIEARIDELNIKVDLLLDYVNQQRLKREAFEDLMSDLSLIAKDAYDTSVTMLENKGVELDMDELRQLVIGVIKNIPNINRTIGMMESLNDLLTDLAPITREMIIDFIHLMHRLEQRGLFEYLKQMQRALGEINRQFTPDDMKNTVDQLGTMIEIIKNISQPQVLAMASKATAALVNTKYDAATERKSVFGLARQLNSPEVRDSLGYMIKLLKNIQKQ